MKVVSFFALAIINICLFAADGSVVGEVIDRDTQQPLIGANVIIKSISKGAASDYEGRFAIRDIPVGSYTVDVSMIGYESVLRANVNVSTNRQTPIKIYLTPSSIKVDEIVAQAGYFERVEDAIVSNQTIDREEIRSDPVGAYDIQMMVHSLPSVITATDQSNEIVVRGGGPSENLFIVDHLEVPNPNHFGRVGTGGGPVNIINTEFVERVDFFAGGFPARYGDKQSSVMDIQLREGSYSQFELDLEMSMAGIGFLAEGPIFNKRGSFISSYRKSFIEHLIESAGMTSVPEYSNTQHKLTYNINSKNKLIFNLIAASDSIEIKDESRPDLRKAENVSYSGYQYTAGVTYKSLFSRKGYHMVSIGKTLSSWDAEVYEVNQASVDTFFYRQNTESDNFIRWDLSYKLSENLKVSTGVNIKNGMYSTDESLDADTVVAYSYPDIPPNINLNEFSNLYEFEASYPDLIYALDSSDSVGVGILIYGMIYLIFHDIIVHNRFGLNIPIKINYIKKVKKSHMRHHKCKNKRGATNFGFITYR